MKINIFIPVLWSLILTLILLFTNKIVLH